MSHTTNWRPDPYGIHEFRFFSADGKPTFLVRDGEKTSYDKPPLAESTSGPEPQGPPLRQDSVGNVAATSDAEPAPSLPPPAPRKERSETVETQANSGDSLGAPALPGSRHTAEEQKRRAAYRVPQVEVAAPKAHTADHQIEPIARPLKIAFGIVFGLLAVSALGLLVVHLSHSAKGITQRETTVTSTTKSTHNFPTTTVVRPTAPKPSPEAAAQALVLSWSTGNRLAALSVATPAAATTLFAAPYNSGLAVDRGCSTSFTPIVCTFGPPGGASPTDPIYEILVSQSSDGWYVSSVKIQN